MRALIKVFLIIMAFPIVAAGGTVYKWVDENGQVHYGQHGGGKVIEFKQSGHPERAAAARKRTADLERWLDAREKERTHAVERKAEEDHARQEKAKYCNEAGIELAKLERGGRIYEPLANNERRYLDEKEVRKRAEEVRANVEHYCQ